MRKYISNTIVQAVKEMCENMKLLADYSPKWNHIMVGGYFVDSPDYRHNPYASVTIKGIQPGQLEELVSACNPTRAKYYTGYDCAMKPAYSDNELSEFIDIVSGDFCNIHCRMVHKFPTADSTGGVELP